MSDDSEQPYKIDGPKVWLSVTAREMARQSGMSDVEFARYLMNRQRLGDEHRATTDEEE
jgi:hypothetical protein